MQFIRLKGHIFSRQFFKVLCPVFAFILFSVLLFLYFFSISMLMNVGFLLLLVLLLIGCFRIFWEMLIKG